MREDIAARKIANELAARTIQLLIELDLDGVPIAGTVQQKPHGHRATFNGWLQLTETIESIRRASLPSPAAALHRTPTRKRAETQHGHSRPPH